MTIVTFVDMILSDRASCEAFFDFKIDVQFIEDVLERHTRDVLRGGIGPKDADLVERRTVEIPVWVAAGAILILKGLVKRPRGAGSHRRASYQEERAAMRAKLRTYLHPVKPPPDPTMKYARERYQQIRDGHEPEPDPMFNKVRAEYKEKIRAGDKNRLHYAKLLAAEEAKLKFKSDLLATVIARRIHRPSEFP
jgi:hypothetical protein